jgi:hypothetical protein
MRAYLLSAFPEQLSAFIWLRDSAEQDPFGQHQLVAHPDQTDIILVVENHAHGDPYCLSVRHYPVYRRFREKCFIYHDDDKPLLCYDPSIRKRDYLADHCRSAGYIARIAKMIPFATIRRHEHDDTSTR